MEFILIAVGLMTSLTTHLAPVVTSMCLRAAAIYKEQFAPHYPFTARFSSAAVETSGKILI